MIEDYYEYYVTCATCLTKDIADKWLTNRVKLYSIITEARKSYVDKTCPKYDIPRPENILGDNRWKDLGFKLEDPDPLVRGSESKRWKIRKAEYEDQLEAWTNGYYRYEQQGIDDNKECKKEFLKKFTEDEDDIKFILNNWGYTKIPGYKIKKINIIENL